MKIQLFVENSIQTNCWVVIDEETKEAIIIDLGGGFNKIEKYLSEENAKLKYLLCTHGHFDHIMGIPEMQEKYPNIPIYINKKDENISELNKILCLMGITSEIKNIKNMHFIDEDSELKIGNKKIEIFETPGHTQGGLCFKIENNLFSGDSLFYRNIGRCDLPGGNYDTLINSLKTKIVILSDNIDVYPGHGCTTTLREEKKYNHYLQ